MNTYAKGQTIDLGPWTLDDANGNPTTATSSACTVYLPDGTTSTPSVTNPSVGTYSAAYTTTLAGPHRYHTVLSLADGTAVHDGEFHVDPSPADAQFEPVVSTLRSLIAASATEYTAAGQTWWSDAQLQTQLQTRRTYIAGGEVEWVVEPIIGGSGRPQWKRGYLNVPGLIEPYAATGGTAVDWKIMTPSGVVPGGTVTTWQDGQVTFTTDQAGANLEFYGYVYDVFGAAADCLDVWASHVKTAYDFKTDDQEFSRSQAHQMLTERAREMRRQQPPSTATLTVGDDYPAGSGRRGAMTANQRRTWGM